MFMLVSPFISFCKPWSRIDSLCNVTNVLGMRNMPPKTPGLAKHQNFNSTLWTEGHIESERSAFPVNHYQGFEPTLGGRTVQRTQFHLCKFIADGDWPKVSYVTMTEWSSNVPGSLVEQLNVTRFITFFIFLEKLSLISKSREILCL